MKNLCWILMALSGLTLWAEDYTAHEWGTFTSVSASNGELMDGLYLEEESLPAFVHEFSLSDFRTLKMRAGQSSRGEIAGVNIKMETPVIYFYSKEGLKVKVDVGFDGGIINQWYPQARNKKRRRQLILGKDFTLNMNTFKDLDFRKNYRDDISWDVEVLPRDTFETYSSPQNLESPTWVAPRFTDANLLQVGKERERFIFYRGLAHFQQPLKITAQSNEKITLRNAGNEDIPFALVYEYKRGKGAQVWWSGSVKSGTQIPVAKGDLAVSKLINGDFCQALVDAGLYEKEAVAMLETWRHSYFEQEGLRVFWIVPRKFTDKVLPIKFSPAPKNLERVLVGRTEVLTPQFERELMSKYVNTERILPKERFFAAWKNRVKQLIESSDDAGLRRFEVLKQIDGRGLDYGHYYIDKKEQAVKSTAQFGTKLLLFGESPDLQQGDFNYYFHSPKSLEVFMRGMPLPLDRRADFSLKDGALNGECRIYALNGNEEELVETRLYKSGHLVKP